MSVLDTSLLEMSILDKKLTIIQVQLIIEDIIPTVNVMAEDMVTGVHESKAADVHGNVFLLQSTCCTFIKYE